jgi:hypothetical protein
MGHLMVAVAQASLTLLSIFFGLGSIGYAKSSAEFLPNGRLNRERDSKAGAAVICTTISILSALIAGLIGGWL